MATEQTTGGTFRLMFERDTFPHKPKPVGVPLDDVAVALDDYDAPIVAATEDGGLRVARRPDLGPIQHTSPLLWAMILRRNVIRPPASGGGLGREASRELVLPWSPRWTEAISTTLIGGWCDPLASTGYLPAATVGALRAEARRLHRQLVPVWRRRTRHGRVLSLDAELGSGLSLHDLVVCEVDLLAHTAGGVFEEERLNRVLQALTPDEQQVVYVYAEGEGTTWTEAAAAIGAADPEAFGERVRRKSKRLAKEQARRTAQRQDRR
ncbi:hypothetical protein OHA02_52175 [Streptomyces phaeochromogenes]|nr:hypothetical protein [Streptomyces phaeochromogenes]